MFRNRSFITKKVHKKKRKIKITFVEKKEKRKRKEEKIRDVIKKEIKKIIKILIMVK